MKATKLGQVSSDCECFLYLYLVYLSLPLVVAVEVSGVAQLVAECRMLLPLRTTFGNEEQCWAPNSCLQSRCFPVEPHLQDLTHCVFTVTIV